MYQFSVQSVFVLKTIWSDVCRRKMGLLSAVVLAFRFMQYKDRLLLCYFLFLSLVFLHSFLLNYEATGPRWDCFLLFFKPFNLFNTKRGNYYCHFFVLSLVFLHGSLLNYEVTMHLQFCMYQQVLCWCERLG